MLREAISASNDFACPEPIESEPAPSRRDIGAHLDNVSPEYRAAAVLRSRRMPEPDTVKAAWRNLSPSTRDQFGEAGLVHHFYNVVCQDTVREVTLDAGRRGDDAANLASAQMDRVAFAALPALYGTPEAEPAWALSDTPLSFPEPFAPLAPITPTRMPPKVRAKAIARSRRIPGLDAIMAAWSRLPVATQDILGVQAVACAFYGHLSGDGLGEPADRWITDVAARRCQGRTDRALNLMDQITQRALPELYGNRKRDPAWADLNAEIVALDVIWEAALPSPVQSGIALHKAAWRALQARAAFIKSTDDVEGMWPFSWPAEQAEEEAFMDLLMTACRDRADAKAMVDHIGWYLQTLPQHPKRAVLSAPVAAQVAVRLRDLAMILGRDVAGAAPVAVPGVLAGLVAEHRAAWSDYLADPEGLVRGSDRRFYLSCAVGEASRAILLAPCADRAEAAAFIEHAEWWRAELEAAGDTLADGFTCEAKDIAARAGDLSLLLSNTSR